MIKRCVGALGLVFELCIRPVAAAPTWIQDTGSAIVTETADGPNTWKYDIVLTNGFSDRVRIIGGALADKISRVDVTIGTNRVLQVEVSGARTNQRILAVGSIGFKPGVPPQETGWFRLRNTFVEQGVSTLDAHSIMDSEFDNDVGSIHIRQASTEVESRLENVEVRGSITQSLLVDRGRIVDATVRGRLGAPGATGVTCQVNGVIDLFTVGEINGQLRCNYFGTEVTSWIDRLTVSNANGQSGDVNGLIRAPGIARQINIAGDLNGDIDVFDNTLTMTVPFDSTPHTTFDDRMIVVGKSFTAGHTIRVRKSIGSQIVFNNSNTPGAVWAGTVNISDATDDPYPNTIITGPEYAVLSDVIGGGSVGLSSFVSHKTDCIPADGASVGGAAVPGTSVSGSPKAQIMVRHYGPVTATGLSAVPTSPAEYPIVLERRRVGETAWTDRSSCFDSIQYEPTTVGQNTLVNNPNVVLVRPTYRLIPGCEYRVSPRTTGTNPLRSSTTGAPVAGSSAYTFTVEGCQSDFNFSGQVDTQDLTTFLGQFGQQSSVCDLPADLNLDGAVNTIDLTAFLGDFGLPCASARPANQGEPASAAPSTTRVAAQTRSSRGTTEQGRPGDETSGPFTPPGPLLLALGFTSLEEHQAYVDSLTPEALRAHLLRLLEAATNLIE